MAGEVSLGPGALEALVRGAVDAESDATGTLWPRRFTPAQRRALGSVRAWHPGVFRRLAECTAGVRLEFETDATTALLEVTLPGVPKASQAVLERVASWEGGGAPEPPYDGISVEVDGRSRGIVEPDADGLLELALDAPAERGLVQLPGMADHHNVRVWLPALQPCGLRSLVADGSFVEPAPAQGLLLVLGDSIVQGYVAGEPAGMWAARLADELGLDLLDQGVGGQVFQPGSLADLPARVAPEAIVVAFGENYRYEPCGQTAVEADVRAYLGQVSQAWPDVPTWVLTPTGHLEEVCPSHPLSCFAEVEGIIWDAAAHHPQMRVVDGRALLDQGALADLLADGDAHPNVLGHEQIAERLAYVVRAERPPAEERRAAAVRELARAGAGGTGETGAAAAEAAGAGAAAETDAGAAGTDAETGALLASAPEPAAAGGAAGADGAAAAGAPLAAAADAVPDPALPLAECLRRGVGEVLCAQGGVVVLRSAANAQLVWAADGSAPVRARLREALTCLGAGRGVTCVLGGRDVAREACRALDLPRMDACLLVAHPGAEPPEVATPGTGDPRDRATRGIRVLGRGYAEAVARHYAHPDYLAPGELERLLSAGRVLGGFEDGRLVGFVGEHEDGSVGLLEVLPAYQGQGWGHALLAAKTRAQLAEGLVPWAQVWPANRASLALMRDCGYVVGAERSMWFCS